MTVSILGSGNIAHFFATRFIANKDVIKHVYSPNLQHAQSLAELVNATATDALANVDTTVDLILIAITDDATRLLLNTFNCKNTLCIYTSGSIASTELQTLSNNIACLWPILSITKNNLPKLTEKINTAIVCNTKNQEIIQKICIALNLNTINISNEQKAILHLGATVLNNFTNHLCALTNNTLLENNLETTLLIPLLQNTIDKLKTSEPMQNQTGPAIRYDNATIEAHIKLLENNTALQHLYINFTKSIQDLHKK